jgi:hypothetical protein
MKGKMQEEGNRVLGHIVSLVCLLVALIASIGVIVTVVRDKSTGSGYSSTDLVAGVVALATVVFNLSKMHDARTLGREAVRTYGCFALASVFFTLFLFVFPALDNMTVRNIGFWFAAVATTSILFVACMSLVFGARYLVSFVLGEFKEVTAQDETKEQAQPHDNGREDSQRLEKGRQDDWFDARLAAVLLGLILIVAGVTLLLDGYNAPTWIGAVLTCAGVFSILVASRSQENGFRHAWPWQQIAKEESNEKTLP